jgi:hypothetical protein
MRQIPNKNYFYLLLLTVITVILTLAFFNVYSNYSVKKESYISKNMNNINSLDLKSLLTENSVLFVYVDSIYNNENKEQQEKLLDDLKALDINTSFVFYDNRTKENRKYMKDKYNLDIKDKKMILVFENNELTIHQAIGDELVDDVLNVVYKVDDIDD